jgi:ABC-type long-subunit fatty acid transport system fused permease/ATPase subunit
LSQQFTDRHNEHLKEKVALKEVIYAEEENTRQKLENMREDIKKEERQEQGFIHPFFYLFFPVLFYFFKQGFCQLIACLCSL